MKISVAFIVYNGANYMRSQLDSILAQTQKVEELGAASKIQNFLEKTKSSEPPAKKEDEKKRDAMTISLNMEQ